MTKSSLSRAASADVEPSEPVLPPMPAGDEPAAISKAKHPVTPDGRYFVVRGRLWRMADPTITGDRRGTLVRDLMAGRRAVAAANHAGDPAALAVARADVDRAKRLLGERGPVWWTDGAPDVNRQKVRATPYAAWYEALSAERDGSQVEAASAADEPDDA